MMKVDITGIDETIAMLDKKSKGIQRAKKTATVEIAMKTMATVKEKIVGLGLVDTGDMVGNIQADISNATEGNAEVVGGEEYTVHKEYGHLTRDHSRFIAGGYFFRDSATTMKKESVGIVSNAVKREVGK